MLPLATLPGTTKLTPADELIILMKDEQTTGGYPRLLQLSDSHIYYGLKKSIEIFLKNLLMPC